MKTKLVLVWIDRDGFELTGRYRDRLSQVPETRATLQAKAARFGDDTPDHKARLLAHIEQEKINHIWMGWVALPEGKGLMDKARRLALETYEREKTQQESLTIFETGGTR